VATTTTVKQTFGKRIWSQFD